MRIRGDHDELAIEGRLDVRTAADARSVLHRAVDHGHGDLVLDLSGLDSWDATGLGVLMGTHRRAGRCGRRMVLRGVPAQLQRLLVATKLHRILAIEGYVPDLGTDLGGDLSGDLPADLGAELPPELPATVLPVSAG